MSDPRRTLEFRVLEWCQREGCIFTDTRRASLAALLREVREEDARVASEECCHDCCYKDEDGSRPDGYCRVAEAIRALGAGKGE